MACTPATDEEPQTGTTEQTMYACGSEQPDITSDATSGFDATVGRLFRGNAFICSAVALTRNTAITARHCFDGGDNPAEWSFRLPQGATYSQPLTAIISHPWAWDILEHDCVGEGGIETAIPDVAVIWFGPDPIPPSVMAEPAEVSFVSKLEWVVDFPYAFYIAGFGHWFLDLNDGERRRGQVGGVEFESDISCIPGWGLQAPSCYLKNGSTTAGGDSGGGLFMVSGLPPYEVKLVGIDSGKEDSGAWTTWASTSIRKIYREEYNALCSADPNLPGCEFTSNASLIMQALGDDADEDDVPDDVDNCPPSWCVNQLGWPPEACFNPDGADSDDDGRGDVCDPCPFDNAPWPFDTDGDGRPDTCDNCPHNPLPSTDYDGDGVGDLCDCPGVSVTPYQPCASAADCVNAGHCIVSQHGNHCSRLPDADGDEQPDACDTCPGNPNDTLYGISADSNVDAQEKWASWLTPVLDPCDEVPQMTMRPIGLAYEDKDDLCVVDLQTSEPCIDSVRFAATAAVGSVDDTTKSFGPAPVGFRHCDCYDNGNALEREECLLGQCELFLGDYYASGNYHAVTVTTGNSTIYPSSQGDPYFDRTFSSAVSKDTSVHPSDHIDDSDWEAEIWRVGTAETITWRVRLDLDAGNVTGHGSDGDETTGLFWSIVLPTLGLTASARDASTGQQLRSTYSYLKTPVVGLEFSPAAHPDFIWACKFCSILLPGEHALINPFEQNYYWPYMTPVRIISVDEQLILSAGDAQPAYEASPFLSPAVQRLLLDGKSAWLTPVESGVEARRLRPGAHLVAIPESWDGSARVLEVVEQNGLLQLAGEIVGPDPRSPAEALDAAILAQAEPAADPALGAARVPGPRSGARALLSLRAGGLLLVGGQTGTLPSSGEIWRYDLDSRVWSETIYDPPKIETLKALAFDGARQWLLVLDEVDEQLFTQGSVGNGGGGGKVFVCHDPPGKGEPHTIEIAAAALPAHLGHGDSEGACAHDGVRTVTRLIAVSLANGRAWVLGSWIHERQAGLPLRRYQRLALGAVREGAFLLLGWRADLDAIDVFRLELSPSGEPSWTGHATVPGRLVEEPARAVDGLVAALWRDGREVLVTFTEAELTPSTQAPQGF